MSKSSKSGRQLSPLHLGLIAVFILGAFLLEWINGGSKPSPGPAATATMTGTETTAVTLPTGLTATPTGAGLKPTRTFAPTLPAAATKTPADSFGKFDYFVLALSWAPDYCAANGSSDPQECGLGKKLGFVLHGLWPQYNQGYPSNCGSEPLPAAVKAQFPGLYPNDTLFEHEWAKHGTCSGLTPERYLAFTRQIKDSVAIPPSLRAPQSPIRTTAADLKDQRVVSDRLDAGLVTVARFEEGVRVNSHHDATLRGPEQRRHLRQELLHSSLILRKIGHRPLRDQNIFK